MKKASDYLIGFKMISPKQYQVCRDGGYSQNELLNRSYTWYSKNRSNIIGKATGPATKKQLQYISERMELDINEPTFSEARRIIQQNALEEGTDTIYIEQFTIAIDKYNEHNANRNNRKRSEVKKTSTGKFVNFENDVIPETFNDEDLTEDMPSFFVEQESNKRDLAWYLQSDEDEEIEGKRAFDEMMERLALKKTAGEIR